MMELDWRVELWEALNIDCNWTAPAVGNKFYFLKGRRDRSRGMHGRKDKQMWVGLKCYSCKVEWW